VAGNVNIGGNTSITGMDIVFLTTAGNVNQQVEISNNGGYGL
jgi:hypothetical protein